MDDTTVLLLENSSECMYTFANVKVDNEVCIFISVSCQLVTAFW